MEDGDVKSRPGRGERFMKLITADMKMAELIHSNYLLIPVVTRFGIRFGFGEKTVKTVCRENGIDVDFFLSIVNTFSYEEFFPQKTLQSFNVLMIMEYLKKTHSYYMDVQIPIIESHISALVKRSRNRNPSLRMVRKFFFDYKKELFEHLRREESVTFPYIENVYRRFSKKPAIRSGRAASQYSMSVYEKEHHNVDDKLYDLKSILIKYIKGDFDETAVNAIIFELFRLEKDIKDHTRIEENILRPIVAQMERTLQSRAA
jgi:regulator of cell morphogenesis and NO signaling